MTEELTPGTLVGHYRLLFRLGKGGMGEVWAASQTRSEFGFQKLIALKVLRAKEMTSHAAVMFFDEARAAASLQHAAIVPTVDLGRDGDVLFIAMDMVHGPSLTALLQRLVIHRAAMSPAIVAYIGIQIASALDYAHERATFEGTPIRLVHRDVSPHNVLLDLNGAVRLTDFGVARTAIQTHESHVGTVRGKPSYMAPEQVQGSDIDGRTDLFSLGVVLYESATLTRLFGRSNPVKSMDAVLKHRPRSILEVDQRFPEPLWRVIERALAKDPAARFQRAADLVSALIAVSRALPGASSAARDLSQLITSSFPPGAFDTEERVREAMVNAPLGNPTEKEDATRLARAGSTTRPLEPAKDKTVLREMKTVPSWPSAAAPDPLAPEAIEEARTRFATTTPAALRPMHFLQPLHAASSDALPVKRAHRTNLVVVGGLTFTAIVLLSIMLVVGWNGGASPKRITATTHAPMQRSPSRAMVRATPQPSVESSAGLPDANPTPSREADMGAPPENDPTSVARRRSPLRPLPAPRRSGASGVTPSLAEVAGGAGSTPEDHATREQVRVLLQRVKHVDPDAYSEMFPTFVEAGADNVAALNDLRAKARSILGRRSE